MEEESNFWRGEAVGSLEEREEMDGEESWDVENDERAAEPFWNAVRGKKLCERYALADDCV